jgi:hypothetical protein
MPHEESADREEHPGLFKEWEEDYALRRAPTEAPPPHPWPSEIASENRQAQPDQQAGEKSDSHDTGYSL